MLLRNKGRSHEYHIASSQHTHATLSHVIDCSRVSSHQKLAAWRAFAKIEMECDQVSQKNGGESGEVLALKKKMADLNYEQERLNAEKDREI